MVRLSRLTFRGGSVTRNGFLGPYLQEVARGAAIVHLLRQSLVMLQRGDASF